MKNKGRVLEAGPLVNIRPNVFPLEVCIPELSDIEEGGDTEDNRRRESSSDGQ